MKRTLISCVLTMAGILGASVHAEDPPLPKPTVENVPYGAHEKQVLDFWKAETDKPAPLMFFTHGGGWMTGDKQKPDFLVPCLKSGISVVSINYRLIPDAMAAKVQPPVQWCLQDAARALQFVRSKATEWHLDKQHIGAVGGSAGGFTSLWLAYHPDMADPKSADSVARESTSVSCVLCFVPQTSLDPVQMKQWLPNINYGNHAFALPNYQDFIDQREKLMPWIKQWSPYELVTKEAPPTYLFYDSVPALGQPYKDPPHSANFGAGLAEKLKSLGVPFEFNYTGATGIKHPDLFGFLVEHLKGTSSK